MIYSAFVEETMGNDRTDLKLSKVQMEGKARGGTGFCIIIGVDH